MIKSIIHTRVTAQLVKYISKFITIYIYVNTFFRFITNRTSPNTANTMIITIDRFMLQKYVFYNCFCFCFSITRGSTCYRYLSLSHPEIHKSQTVDVLVQRTIRISRFRKSILLYNGCKNSTTRTL